MRKTIKIEELKKEIQRLVNTSIEYQDEGKTDMFEYCYNKAICYLSLIKDMCVDYSKSSYSKECNGLEEWFDKITKDAIYK